MRSFVPVLHASLGGKGLSSFSIKLWESSIKGNENLLGGFRVSFIYWPLFEICFRKNGMPSASWEELTSRFLSVWTLWILLRSFSLKRSTSKGWIPLEYDFLVIVDEVVSSPLISQSTTLFSHSGRNIRVVLKKFLLLHHLVRAKPL